MTKTEIAIIETNVPSLSTIAALAAVPKEEVWLAKQKSARTRRAYRLDVKAVDELPSYDSFEPAPDDF